MISLKFAVDTRPATNALEALEKRQIPFATALALTRTAQAAQTEVREGMKARFIIRRPVALQNVQYEAARKDHLEATVFAIAPFMGLQEEGGVKRPMTALELAIPQGLTPRQSALPARQAMGQPGTFIAQGPAGRFIGRRVGRQPFAVLYALRRQASVPARLGMTETVERVASERFPQEMRTALDIALRTAK